VRVHRPDAFGTALLARYGRAPKDAEINQRPADAGDAITCEAEAELVNASILVSDLYQVRLLPIGVRGRQHDQCHIGMTTEEGGEDDRQQQSCSERHRFSVLHVASIEYGH
jgi:hypothetical protein